MQKPPLFWAELAPGAQVVLWCLVGYGLTALPWLILVLLLGG